MSKCWKSFSSNACEKCLGRRVSLAFFFSKVSRSPSSFEVGKNLRNRNSLRQALGEPNFLSLRARRRSLNAIQLNVIASAELQAADSSSRKRTHRDKGKMSSRQKVSRDFCVRHAAEIIERIFPHSALRSALRCIKHFRANFIIHGQITHMHITPVRLSY